MESGRENMPTDARMELVKMNHPWSYLIQYF